ncbi:autotransporter outer membrane beta-barrel domain-containing protein [Haemophilus sp. oral taxon 851]|uniref:autotransporter family protein n=1 Tax=Haemophilus sp. oral taxon 851 TaxID=762964 RepID=UPI0002462986|nr:autotransporter outer membrane beta-barrel domain-containing protein [Haemophilus sp. oral taxon 851]EHO48667.1 outer membrane autotransporter barrel domain protein [Haemophilus sp. oral taxon 851 str. F0397]
MIVRGNSTAEIKNLNINVTKSNREKNTSQSADSDAAYGLAVGYNWNGGSNTGNARVNVENANITVNNTADTVRGNYTGVPIPGGKFETGYQYSGIRVYRSTGSTPEFHSTGKVDIKVSDVSANKVADYMVGLYVSGNDAKAILDGDTNISVTANGINSAGIKIGKPGNGDAGKNATVEANGKLTVDTTSINGTTLAKGKTYRGSGAVRLFDEGSKFTITGEKNKNEASEIRTSTNALVFDTIDYENLGEVKKFFTFYEMLARGKDNKNNQVSLVNTKLSTTSKTDSLILANARFKKEGDLMWGAKLLGKQDALLRYFTWGAFNVKNATFKLSGDKSIATAASKGWAVYAKSEKIDEANKTAEAHSELTATFSDGAKLTGLVHQDIGSTLTMNVDNKAVWFLNKKEDETEQRSTAKSVTLSNGGVLDAGSHPAEKYIVKVSSNGADKDGTFTNDHGIITLANQSYADKLTIEGNYEGKDGVLKVNTKWNTTGDYLGTNSESDLLTITGDASGNTTVKAVKTDGTEDVIDGTIGELTDRYKRSVPVIKVLGKDNGTEGNEINSTDATKPYAYNTRSTFTGTAKTTGAGELQLVSHKDDNGVTEYFWTLTTPNKDKTIITPSAPAYALVPRQNLELGYTMLDTLHQRRGENQTLSWDKQGSYWQDVEKQSWGRVIGKHLKLDGKERFGLKTNMYGFQVGHDFDVKTKQDDEGKLTRRFTGLYFGALRSHSKFYDEYRAKNGVVIADKLTSRVKTTALNLGVTDTRYNENGTYIDWVGQLSWLNNRYSSVDGTQAKNHGWGAALSVETGRPYALGKDKTNNGDSWILEPQAQLIAQYLRLGNFNDGTRAVSQKGYGLRGRVGFRLAYNTPNDKQRTRTYYFIGNIWHDFKATGNALIGRDKLTEEFDRTWWELGLGSQFSLSENTYLYADARYEKSFDSNRHKGYQGTVGVKYSWK